MNTSVKYQKDGQNIIYCNIQSTNQSEGPQRADINISRNVAIVENPSQYYLSVVRFKIPTYKIPLFITDRILVVSMTYNGLKTDAFVTYTPTNTDPQYTIYGEAYFSYQHFLDSINEAIRTCCVALNLILPGPSPFLDQPYLIYNAETQLFSLIALNGYADVYPYTNALVPKIFFNNALYNFFGNLLCIETQLNPLGIEYDNQLIIENTINNTITWPVTLPAAPHLGFEMKQEYTTTYLMNNLTSIVLASNNLPVVAENTMDADIGGDVNTSKTTLKIINDFEPVVEGAGIQRSYQYYQPSTYRYSDMLSSTEITNINLQIYLFMEQTKQYIPIMIDPGFAVSIKLMFKRKELNY